MKGDNHLLALSTKTVTADEDPTLEEGTERIEPLFAFPVQVAKATDGGRDPSWDIVAPSGAKREQVFIDPTYALDPAKLAEETDPEVIQAMLDKLFVEDADCKRGVLVGDRFHEVPQAALEQVAKVTQAKTMVVQGAIARTEFMFEYGHLINGIYWIQSPPKGGSHKAYRLAYEALREIRKGRTIKRPARVVVTKRTARSRQKIVALFADEARGCIGAYEMAPVPSFKEPDDLVTAPMDSVVEERQIEMARLMIDNLPDAREWLDEADDDAIALKHDLREAAVLGSSLNVPDPVAETEQSDDLSALLLASIAQLK